MSIIQDVATIEGQGHVQLNVLIQAVMSPREGGVPVQETTLSLPATVQVAPFCDALSIGDVVTFRLIPFERIKL